MDNQGTGNGTSGLRTESKQSRNILGMGPVDSPFLRMQGMEAADMRLASFSVQMVTPCVLHRYRAHTRGWVFQFRLIGPMIPAERKQGASIVNLASSW